MFGNVLSGRTILGYWEGKCNSEIRKKLVNIWTEDEELDFQNQTTVPGLSAIYKFYRAKFCICPAGLHHTSARITKAIHYGCVPGKSHHNTAAFFEILFVSII